MTQGALAEEGKTTSRAEAGRWEREGEREGRGNAAKAMNWMVFGVFFISQDKSGCSGGVSDLM